MNLTCELCGEKTPEIKCYKLCDKDGIVCGDYCSKECASADAWGPRFRPYQIWPAQRAVQKRPKVSTKDADKGVVKEVTL